MKPIPARFPDPRVPTGVPDVVLTGHDPNERGAEYRPKKREEVGGTKRAA
jgi:3-phenylpropionate/trans-cinnamate dioxygenase ferredoxin reductase subunit